MATARFLSDTDVSIDLTRGLEPTRSRIGALLASGADVGLCPVQLAEFYAGRRRGHRVDWDAFVDSLPSWEIAPEAAIQLGRDRSGFARRGRTVHTPDAPTAAVGWRMRATVITRNAKDFPVPGMPRPDP